MDSVSDEAVRVTGRNIDWPAIHENLQQKIANAEYWSDNHSTQAFHLPAEIKTTILYIARRDATQKSKHLIELNIFGNMRSSEPNWAKLYINLYWRSVRQVTAWQVFRFLEHHGVLNWECLTCDMESNLPSTGMLKSLLACFSKIAEWDKQSQMAKVPMQNGYEYNADVQWLAAVIGQSNLSIRLDVIAQLIAASGLLGEILEGKYAAFKKSFPDAKLAGAQQGQQGQQNSSGRVPSTQTFGSWLPHKLSRDVRSFNAEILSYFARAATIEKVCSAVDPAARGLLTLTYEAKE
ncbi:hypothetical protein N7532_010775 [Penicillium argentinense]|uniref:Uncharacterized protein n=1 Tax=Penicillium argentinense TaxID=1131581 RepID=A0A9W9EQL2_9EURO|nr:uncharacterized protein N7532_010775 [Penicillium argentinense]KAJ5086004.1 hypothetical protein N7532_010775 [Penicillium argentinense]